MTAMYITMRTTMHGHIICLLILLMWADNILSTDIMTDFLPGVKLFHLVSTLAVMQSVMSVSKSVCFI